ncbi:MAG TPA: HAD family hydrolase [Verrucomicrobiae bacterium]|nr:HAD family hydrolase [Verrucomicrobiae bacterium]
MKAVFLDRDGTLIVDPPDLRVDSISKIHLFPDVFKAMKRLSELDYAVFIVTNQAGIAEGRLSETDFERLNGIVLELLQPTGAKIRKTYVCPHGEDGKCECRKPKPKLLFDAAREFEIDLKQSWSIGDRESDILAGKAAGTKNILVKTGNTPVTSDDADYTAADILEAVEYIAAH